MTQIYKDISHLFECFNKIKDEYYFRGYKRAEELKPGLGRYRGYKENEARMFSDLSNLQVLRKLNIRTLRGLFELGQHYGLPTRFLDWTLNPFIALYFAFGKKSDFDNDPVFIACLDKKNQQLTDVGEILDIKILVSDLDPYIFGDLDNFLLSELDNFGPEVDHPFIYEYSKLGLAWNKYQEYVSRIDNFIMFSYKKDLINIRKEAQEGIFSFHKSIHDPFPEKLYKSIEIRFDFRQKIEAADRLVEMGIDNQSLFPDDEVYQKIREECERIRIKYQNTQ